MGRYQLCQSLHCIFRVNSKTSKLRALFTYDQILQLRHSEITFVLICRVCCFRMLVGNLIGQLQ